MKWYHLFTSRNVRFWRINKLAVLVLGSALVLSACSSDLSSTEKSTNAAAAQENTASEANENNVSATAGSSPSVSAAVNAANIDYIFTSQGQDGEQMVLKTINNAQQSIDLAMYNLSRGSIVKALAKAAERGVQVRIISDQSKVNLDDLQRLVDAGVPIRINTFEGKMHEKLMLVDGETALVGSFNYTRASSEENDEVLLAIHDAALTGQWNTIFTKMWDDQERYREWKGN
ncbi:phospholipase D-like domain-containing protein [Paenibacillus bovis]|uniref:phospholipase D n=1 Tax=Paenibacillus bovis TaxID=1616788 RepID=A0A172ZGZ7_9BACL|nr:phospholipase D-like domain-containing protein [Paenibacillus bovis]ANF96803.1 hypothetical protein AR543_12815 [Paenibacillus bovis]